MLEFLDSKLLPTYGFAPMGQLRRFGPNFNEINTSRTKRLTVVISAEKEAEKTGKTLE